ncbi:MAG: response regulator [Pseudolabrys sp.]|nr:response regulator [Pseudolabrys sp.]
MLIVDDDVWQRLAASEMFEGAGYRVLAAASADEAMVIFEGNSDIKLLFTDVSMAGSMDGAELVRRVAVRWPKIATIITSGRFRPEPLPQNTRFHAKPYMPADVLKHARELTTDLS